MGNVNDLELFEQIDNYLNNKLSIKEKNDFEEKMAINEKLREEVMIQKHLFATFGNKNIDSNFGFNEGELHKINQHINSAELQNLSKKIKEIGVSYSQEQQKKKPKQNNFLRYLVAASITIIFASLFYFQNSNNLHSYYEEYNNWNTLPSFTEKSDNATINQFTLGENLFHEKKYNEAITQFIKIDKNDQFYPYSLLYIGASYEQLNENQKAIQVFQQVSKLNTFEEKSKGLWYEFLIYLKLEDREKAKTISKIILEDQNNYNYEKTLQIKL